MGQPLSVNFFRYIKSALNPRFLGICFDAAVAVSGCAPVLSVITYLVAMTALGH